MQAKIAHYHVSMIAADYGHELRSPLVDVVSSASYTSRHVQPQPPASAAALQLDCNWWKSISALGKERNASSIMSQ